MPTPNKKYFFQQNKRRITKKFFEKGTTGAACVLLALKEAGEGCLEDIPDYYFLGLREMLGVGRYKKPKVEKETLRINLVRLEKQGLIAKTEKKNFYCLTEEGKTFVAYIKDMYSVLNKPWDGKFRIVMFDIPAKKKEWRHWLRKELALVQFQLLQQSVYIGKHPLPDVFYEQVNEAGLNEFIFVLTIGEIDKKRKILELFK